MSFTPPKCGHTANDQCRCLCHRTHGMKHCMPCCRPCPDCGMNIDRLADAGKLLPRIVADVNIADDLIALVQPGEVQITTEADRVRFDIVKGPKLLGVIRI